MKILNHEWFVGTFFNPSGSLLQILVSGVLFNLCFYLWIGQETSKYRIWYYRILKLLALWKFLCINPSLFSDKVIFYCTSLWIHSKIWIKIPEGHIFAHICFHSFFFLDDWFVCLMMDDARHASLGHRCSKSFLMTLETNLTILVHLSNWWKIIFLIQWGRGISYLYHLNYTQVGFEPKTSWISGPHPCH